MIEAIDHLNIVVRDLPGMRAFYRDVLGLKVTKEVSIRGAWIDRTVGLEGVDADVVYLEAVGGGTRIELIAYRSPLPETGTRLPPDANRANLPGVRHFAFRVTGIDDLVASLRRAGVSFLSPVQQVPDEQVTYAGGVRKQLVYLRDPEGNLLELCEYAPPVG